MTRGDRIVVSCAVVVVLILGAFGVLLVVTHHQSVETQNQRFHDRAATVASVTQALFDTARSTNLEEANAKLGGARIDPVALETMRSRTGWVYAEVVDDSGKLLAATAGAPTARALAEPAYVRQARAGTFAWSDVYGPANSNDQVTEWAVPYSVTLGRRVLVVGVRISRVSDVITGIMSRFSRLVDGEAAVVDSHDVVLASPTPGIEAGDRFHDRAALTAARGSAEGDYGDGRRYAVAPLPGTPWRVVVTEEKSRLYAEVNGARLTVPWIILVALAAVGAVGLFLLRRANVAAAEIARREANRRYALEINDNVIQRLAVAKLAMETGQAEVTHEKLTDTLREAQNLVSQLLGDKDVESGDLRRREQAPSV